MPTKKTTEEFIQDAIKVHGDKYDYSKVEYINSKTKVIIICKEHGEFEQTPKIHLRKNGCKKCSGKYQYTTKEFIEKAKEVHGDKYDYSKVEYISSKKHITIICKIHGNFRQQPTLHLYNKNGCSKCSGNYSYTTKEWIEKAIKVHGDKYDYSKTKYTKTDNKVIIICKIHGEFLQTAHHHLQNHGCRKCSKTYSYTTKEWVEKATEVHGDKYDYSKTKYTKTDTKVIIICKIHGGFLQTPDSHINAKNGCKECSYITNGINLRKSQDEFIKQSREVHGDRYDYSKVEYEKSNEKVIIICKEHGEFKQIPSSHLQRQGCLKCAYITN